ncbi:glutamate-5-semialdehyde dehydrogenase [Dichotomicrobium thermohalophilum]|uniref:Gamma-glutamyl phosphate reductase n=2 Tax=Dichotomicrobium thermohalophilum TaxID=933063 RepID=A0A397PCH4_9HYPH|nr:glutamate-5-semialdehyde dehydrogenase [Dichotomicrobium thermohalophilum]
MQEKADKTAGKPLAAVMAELGEAARAAAWVLATTDTATKNAALRAGAAALRRSAEDILAANARDVAAAEEQGRPKAAIDRLRLDKKRIEGIASALEDIVALDDPVGTVIAEWTRPNGLDIQRVRTPIGVIGIIFESRPNVTADAGALCLKSGNAAILRPGSDSIHSSRAIHACLLEGLRAAGLPEAAIQIVPTTDREAVGHMLRGLGGNIDVIVPRGGKSLVERVQTDARVPVFAHLEGICHVYVDKAAKLDMAREVVVNAKMRRPGICGAAETLLVDRACPSDYLPALIDALIGAGCEVRGDDSAQRADARVRPASEEDWRTEYLDAIISVKVVDGVEGALAHIAHYSSHHTEAILTEDAVAAQVFLNGVDSAIVLWNASTQFADGGEFGMGAEIGIATGKMHARGPIGVEQLTSFKYVVRGSGQTRPK